MIVAWIFGASVKRACMRVVEMHANSPERGLARELCVTSS